MKKNIKYSIIILAATISISIISFIVDGESKQHYAPYGAYIPEGINWGYIEYNIQKGDTLTDITKDVMTQYPLIETFIGFDHQLYEIIRVNGLTNSDLINEDNCIIIPIVSEKPIENKID